MSGKSKDSWPKLIRSPSKLNLGLRLINNNDRGYHLIQSLFWPIDWCDEVEIRPNSKSVVDMKWHPSCPRNSQLPSFNKNNISRLLRLLSDQRYKVTVSKRIPIGSGLGGSSSNVGSIAKALNYADIECLDLIGADSAFFLDPVPCWIEGTGSTRIPVRYGKEMVERLFFLLVFPPLGLETRQVFQAYRFYKTSFSRPLAVPSLKDMHQFKAYLRETTNDLLPAACTLYPLVGHLILALSQTNPLYCSMSGSGSTCFAIFDKIEKAKGAFKEILQICRKTNSTVRIARTFKGDSYGNN